ncbi:MAG: pyruvate formate lyase family protein [Candidatus Krumholzibacteriia bacterium]
MTRAGLASSAIADSGTSISDVVVTDRVQTLHAEVLAEPHTLCAERALFVTRFFRRRANRHGPLVRNKARALAYILANKTVRIYERELLVGNFTSHRVGGGLFPELHGVSMIEDLLKPGRRSINPFRIASLDRARLLAEVMPFWLPRFLAARAFPPPQAMRFVADQLSPTFHLINETGGISHFIPDYETLVTIGTDGLRKQASTRLARLGDTGDNDKTDFLSAVQGVCDALDAFSIRYRNEARRLAAAEYDADRRAELLHIAAICDHVPRHPARSFHEGLQAILLAQIALNHESLDNSVCPGRLDQVLWPLYEADVAAGRLDAQAALELLGCFAVKLCEIVPIFSARATRFHGGLFNGQVVTIGGTDRNGADATNELSWLFLELMDRLRTRQPNYSARIHRLSPAPYRRRIARSLADGAVSPALYNDEAIVPLLRSRGFDRADCRDYSNVGCVEPVPAGRGFLSTDAALFNLGVCLELALNQGRRFGHRRRIGIDTPPADTCADVDTLFGLLRAQVEAAVDRLLDDLAAIERANARLHPTPLTSTLLRGCIDSATDASAGGALYNGSGVQGVGVIEVGDSLAAIEHVVFRREHATLAEVVDACRKNFAGFDALRARLRSAPKFGNDDARADGWVARVMALFGEALSRRRSTRDGAYVPGFYSVTAHVAFGELVGALPSGRGAGDPFSSGIAPGSGNDRTGPTAVLRSAASLSPALAPNGMNHNLALDPWIVQGKDGAVRLQALIDGALAAGCMQLQVNVLDPAVLLDARDNPGRYPGLLVRVSGYSAYFDDLSPEMKQEVIDRTLHGACLP